MNPSPPSYDITTADTDPSSLETYRESFILSPPYCNVKLENLDEPNIILNEQIDLDPPPPCEEIETIEDFTHL